MSNDELIAEGLGILTHARLSRTDELNLRLAMSFAAGKKIFGEQEYYYRCQNGIPLDPRIPAIAQVDKLRVNVFRWPDGIHFYPTVDGQDVVEGDKVKWNTHEEAYKAAIRFIHKQPTPSTPSCDQKPNE